MNFLETDNSIVRCDCGTFISVEAGEPNYLAKDDKGQVISRHAAHHMATHRVRCNNCELVFCSHCKKKPYQVGFTCEEK